MHCRKGYRCAIAALTLTAGFATSSATAQTNATFNWSWTDQAGNNHGYRGFGVEGVIGGTNNQVVTESLGVKTLAGGSASYTTARDEADDTLSFWFRTNGRIAGVVNPMLLTNLDAMNEMTTPLSVTVPGAGATLELAEGGNHNVNVAASVGSSSFERALIAGQIFADVHDYMNNTIGFNPSEIDLRYQFGGNQAYYQNAALGGPRITIAGDDYRDYDVLSHEYMHHVAAENGMDDSPGGSHQWHVDNIRGRMDIDKGSKLAFSEGFATAFGIEALRQANAANGLNLPATATDTWYNDDRWGANGALTQSNLAADMELHQTRMGPTGAAMARVNRLGEGEELAVARTIWDLMDNNADNLQVGADRIAYGGKEFFNRVLKPNGGASTTVQMWDNLVEDLNTAEGRGKAGLVNANANAAKAIAGAIFADHGISAHTITTGVIDIRNDGDDLFAMEQNNDNSEWFRAAVFDTDWAFVDWTDPIRDTIHVPVSGAAITEMIRFDIGELATELEIGEDYFWVALSNPAGPFNAALDFEDMSVFDFDQTGDLWYWGAAQAITIIPAPGAITLALLGLATTARRRRA